MSPCADLRIGWGAYILTLLQISRPLMAYGIGIFISHGDDANARIRASQHEWRNDGAIGLFPPIREGRIL